MTLTIDRDLLVEEYGAEIAKEVARELEYYNLHGVLPPDALFIQGIEWYGDNAVIIHRDRTAQ